MQGSERRIPVQQPETGVCQNIIVSSDKILFVEFRPAGTVIIIERIIQEVFFLTMDMVMLGKEVQMRENIEETQTIVKIGLVVLL